VYGDIRLTDQTGECCVGDTLSHNLILLHAPLDYVYRPRQSFLLPGDALRSSSLFNHSIITDYYHENQSLLFGKLIYVLQLKCFELPPNYTSSWSTKLNCTSSWWRWHIRKFTSLVLPIWAPNRPTCLRYVRDTRRWCLPAATKLPSARRRPPMLESFQSLNNHRLLS
jgi:hypothetical protein